MTDPCPPEKRSPMEHERDDLTPEAVERLARQLAFVANRTGMTISKCEAVTDEAAAALRALSAERDALRAKLAEVVDVLRDAADIASSVRCANVYSRGGYINVSDTVSRARATLARITEGEG
jgi:hypothetical protein